MSKGYTAGCQCSMALYHGHDFSRANQSDQNRFGLQPLQTPGMKQSPVLPRFRGLFSP